MFREIDYLDPTDSKAVCECDWCGKDLFASDVYYALDGDRVCEDCWEDYCDDHKRYVSDEGDLYED